MITINTTLGAISNSITHKYKTYGHLFNITKQAAFVHSQFNVLSSTDLSTNKVNAFRGWPQNSQHSVTNEAL